MNTLKTFVCLLGLAAFNASADDRLFLVVGKYAMGEPITQLIEYKVLPHSAMHDGGKPITQVAFLEPQVKATNQAQAREIIPGVLEE